MMYVRMYVSVTIRNVINSHACAQLGDTFMRMRIILLARGPLRMRIPSKSYGLLTS